jgi:hypothetical protein
MLIFYSSGVHALVFFLLRMARTKSSHPRQTEEDSDAGAPNLPIGPDFENDTTNQGSGDAGAPNLPIGPDHEDEDGDTENHSPSVYLNLNQNDEENDDGNAEHEGNENEEDDARNVEHEGDVNEEDEGNAEHALVGTLSTSQVRCGHSPNKLPSGRFVITTVNEVGDPTQALVSVNV